ncbi:anti-sigma factor family protein [Gemmatimonadota bacterium]
MVDKAIVLTQISALLDNELPEKEALAIKQHLLCCHRCRREFEQLKNIDCLLNEWDYQTTKCLKPSTSYEDRLCVRIRDFKKPNHRPPS